MTTKRKASARVRVPDGFCTVRIRRRAYDQLSELVRTFELAGLGAVPEEARAVVHPASKLTRGAVFEYAVAMALATLARKE